jgi:hypothetical protein
VIEKLQVLVEIPQVDDAAETVYEPALKGSVME